MYEKINIPKEVKKQCTYIHIKQQKGLFKLLQNKNIYLTEIWEPGNVRNTILN